MEPIVNATPAINNITTSPETGIRPSVIKLRPISPVVLQPPENNAVIVNFNENQNGDRRSPPPKCAICLSKCKNKSFTDSCLHQFCFLCLSQWSQVRAVCPLCKQEFKSIIHNIRSSNEYEECPVNQLQNPADSLDVPLPSLANYTNQRFRFSTTLTLHRRQELALQNYLLDHNLTHSLYSELLPERPPSPLEVADIADPLVRFRCTIYTSNMWAKPVPDSNGRFRICTPIFFSRHSTAVQQLTPWLNREVSVLITTSTQHFNHIISVIMSILSIHHILSHQFYRITCAFFQRNTQHFQHEFYGYARSPLDLSEYDSAVAYASREEVLQICVIYNTSDTEDDSDVRVVSPYNNYTGVHNNARTGSRINDSLECLNDDPGPSSFISLPENSSVPPPDDSECVVPIEITSSDSDSDACVIVGYLKPPELRTPEHITLNSDTDSDIVVQKNDTPVPMPAIIIKKQDEPPVVSEHESYNSDHDSESSYSSGESYTTDVSRVPKKTRKTKHSVKKQPNKRRRILSTSSDKSDTEEEAPVSAPVIRSRFKSGSTAPLRDYNNFPREPSTSRTNEHSKSTVESLTLANANKGKTLQRGKKITKTVNRIESSASEDSSRSHISHQIRKNSKSKDNNKSLNWIFRMKMKAIQQTKKTKKFVKKQPKKKIRFEDYSSNSDSEGSFNEFERSTSRISENEDYQNGPNSDQSN